MEIKNFFLIRFSKKILICIPISALCFVFPFISNAEVNKPQISLSSFQDSAGVTITILGIGFTKGGIATLFLKNPDGSQSEIQSTQTSADGSFTISHIFPTGYPEGTYFLSAIDGPAGRLSNDVEFTVRIFQGEELKASAPAYIPKHGDLIKVKGDSKIYLVQGQQQGYQRRGITSEEVFKQIGFRNADIKEIDSQDMINIPEGPPIWSKETIAVFSEGTLIKLRGKTNTYVIQGGRKCYIPDSETFHARGYSWDQVKEVDKPTIDSIPTGIPIPSAKPPFQYASPGQAPEFQPPPQSPYASTTIPPETGQTPSQPQSTLPALPNGTLVKGPGSDIYIIENGVRRLIPDKETFIAMRFNLNNVMNLDDLGLRSIPLGTPFPSTR
jgi:hypothetical protein